MEREQRRELINAIRANRAALVECYEANREGTPADTITALVTRIGYANAAKTVAELVNGVDIYDGRIYEYVREWARSIETATTGEDLENLGIYNPSAIHPAHINQLGQAMRKYTPEEPTNPEAEPSEEAGTMTATYRQNAEKKGIEITFSSIPAAEVRTELKAAGYRWHKQGGYWYAKENAETLALAEKLTSGTVKAVEDTPLIIPASVKVEEGSLYEGWAGGNARTWHTDQELKAYILADCKKAGVKVSIRFHRAGYLTAFTATMTIKADEIKTFEEWDETAEPDYTPAGRWVNYTDEAGKICTIYGDDLYTLQGAEFEAMRANIRRTNYELAKRHMLDGNTFSNHKFDLLRESARRRMDTLQAIVDSYNRDQSNTMIDYFDRDIYDDYCVKIA